MKTIQIPNPWKIKEFMEDGKTQLVDLDDYLHPGVAGKIFHDYSSKFTKKLAGFNINTFADLKSEFDKCQAKKSNLPNSIRVIVQGHYTYYMNELKASQAIWDTLSPENLEEAKKHEYLVKKEDDPQNETEN